MSEDVQGLPGVAGLEALVTADDIPGSNQAPSKQAESGTQATQQKTEPTQAQTPAATADREEFDLAQFKNPKELLKGYKEVQGAFTRTTQENKALKDKLAQIEEHLELMKLSQQRPPVQQAMPQQQKDFDQMFIENPQAAVEALAQRKAQSMIVQSKIQDVLEEESLKNPGEFQERYQYVSALARQYPQLVASQAGVRKLFQLADKTRADHQKKQAYHIVSQVFGQDVDMEKFRKLVQRDQTGQTQTTNAYMPDSSSGGRNIPESNAENAEDEVSAAVKKGDPDKVIAALFRQQGLPIRSI
jgi:hypothetical protein